MSLGDGQQRWLSGRYELGEIIGRGGMSTVYRSYDHHMARAVAVKVFQAGPEITDAAEHFRREVMLLAGLREPGIVTVFDAELDVAAPYLVTELVDGPTLLQRIRHAPLTETQVIHLATALANTLADVHAHGIVHRDVTPSNILLPSVAEDPFTAPKLVDFGIAIAADVSRLTAVHLTVGTANYLSPEQLRAEPLTPATDVYSLGLVLIEALSGQPAYPGTGPEAILARLDHSPAVPTITSATLRGALTDMTAADPQDRPDAAQVARRLAELVSSRSTRLPDGGPAASAEPVGRTATYVAARAHRRPRRSHTVVAAAVGIAALAGVAAAGFITHEPDHPAKQAPPGYAAPTTGTSPTLTHAATARPRTPTTASAPRQTAYPATSTAASTPPSRRPATTSSRRPTPPTTPSVSTAPASTSPTSTSLSTSPSTSPSTSTTPSAPSSLSTPESPSATPPTSTPPPSPAP